MVLKLYESDRPRSFGSKVAEYVQKPAWPSLRFLKDQFRVVDQPEGKRIEFAVRSGLPVPLVYTIYVEAKGKKGESVVGERIYDYDHIGPFSTDDWTLEMDGWMPEVVIFEIGIEPFEVRTDRVEIVP